MAGISKAAAALKKVSELAKKVTKKNVDTKGNTTSPLRSQSTNQAKTQKPTENQRRYKVGEIKGAVKATAVIAGATALTKAMMKDDPKIIGTAATAKDKGNKTFTYKGDEYKTPKTIPSVPKMRPPEKKAKTDSQQYMKEKYTGKDSDVKFNAKGGMMKKYSMGGMGKKKGK
jgi:hypothetical protein